MKHFFSMHYVTFSSGHGFQHLPRDLANVNTWKNMFDPYIKVSEYLG